MDPLVRRRAARARGETTAIPPRSLRARVGEPDTERFLRHGSAIAEAITQAAHDHGSSFVGERVLDFGCGCGRTLRHLRTGSDLVDLHGCDVDAAAVAWVGSHVRDVGVQVTRYSPPLPYADASFNVVFSVSTLTHMADDAQDAWLAELARILVPGGLALLSVHGAFALRGFRSGKHSGVGPQLLSRLRALPDLDEAGFAFEPYEDRGADPGKFPGVDAAYGLAFHSERHVRDRWRTWFDVLEIREQALIGWQDLIVARRHDSAHPGSGRR